MVIVTADLLRSIIRFYIADRRLYGETATGNYVIHSRLNYLMTHLFLHISSNEIVRIAYSQSFALTKWSSFQVNLTTGASTYASRRYTQQIRKAAQL